MKNRCTFPRKHRLHLQRDFRRVLALRCRSSDPNITIYIAPNGLKHSRLGLRISRKLGNAVIRNRHKRLIREAFRLLRLAETLPGYDLICIPKPGASRTLSDYQNSLEHLLQTTVRRFAKK